MFVDLWILSLFSLLFGACAYFSRKSGERAGAMLLLKTLIEQNVIMIKDNKIVGKTTR